MSSRPTSTPIVVNALMMDKNSLVYAPRSFFLFFVLIPFSLSLALIDLTRWGWMLYSYAEMLHICATLSAMTFQRIEAVKIRVLVLARPT
jgi:hypothetical protein